MGIRDSIYEASFQAVTGGSPENDKFFQYTPGGSISLGVYKEDVFQVGQEYYLDLSPAAASAGPD